MIVPAAHYGARQPGGDRPGRAGARDPRNVASRARGSAAPTGHGEGENGPLPGALGCRGGPFAVAFEGYDADNQDGLRFSRGEDWVHVRPSGTEPVVRVIAESASDRRTRELIETARHALQGTR